MKGWRIFAHSVGMVWRNLGWAARIALVPVLIGLAAIGGIVALAGGGFEAGFETAVRTGQAPVQTSTGTGADFAFAAAVVLVIVVVQLWVFVAWHRFVLLEEYPESWVPPFKGRRMLSYFGHGLLIALLLLVMALPIFVVLGISVAFQGPAGSVLAVLGGVGGMMLLLVAAFRMSAALPAAAIGKPLKLGDSWSATKGASGAFVLVFILLALLQGALQYVGDLSLAVFAPLGIAYALLAAFVMTMANVSILTTIYGHFVEGRPV